tara:strand:- start:1546 stop:1797 length:252 start_codon:yes stop_codon:yes gene_type:complete
VDYIKQAESIKTGETLIYFTGELSRSREIEIRENARTGSGVAPIAQMGNYFWGLHEECKGYLVQRRTTPGVTGFEYLYVGARR